MEKLIVIVGPTGVGKTKLSIELAKKLNGEIISGDSVQVYKEMNIGSAKIKEEEKENIEHYLIDIKDISEDYSVYDFQKEVREKIELIKSKNKTPILVGGTGLYLKAALYDYEFQKDDNNDFNDYKELSNEEAYNLLVSLDPVEANKLHPNNRVRVVRALNIIKNNNMSKTELLAKQEHKLLYDATFIGLTAPRETVYKRINDRVDLMVKEGLIKEAEGLYHKYKDHNYSSLKAIGYKELFEYFKGNISKDEAIELIKKRTRNYAKRQYTWFNNQFEVKWFETDFNNFDNTINEVVKYLMFDRVFETKNLIIKKGAMDDAYNLHVNIWSQEESARYVLWSVTNNLEEAQNRLKRWLERQKTNINEWLVYDKVSKKAIGYLSVEEISPSKYVDIGIGIGKEYSHKGLGSELLEFLLAYIKEKGGKQVEYSCMRENEASKRLAEKFGFKYFKTEKALRKYDNKEFDLDFYVLEIKE